MATLKAAVLGGIFGVGLAAILFVPVWFVLAFISRLLTGHVHMATFVIAGFAAIGFMIWVFRLVFAYFRRGFSQPDVSRPPGW